MEKRVEFRCSADSLLECAINLAKQGQWPPGWSFHNLGKRNALGFTELQVGRKLVSPEGSICISPPGATEVLRFDPVGTITFAGINQQNSALIVSSSNQAVLAFFDDLVAILLKYQAPTTVSVPRPSAGAATIPQEPPKPPEPKTAGAALQPWLDWYDQMRDGGFRCTLKDVAGRSGYSYGYVKQRHAIHRSQPRGIS